MDPKARGYAEEAIRALGRMDVSAARMSIAQAFDFDPKIGALSDAVYLACAEIESEDTISMGTWNTLADAVDSPELVAVVESCRF